MVGRNFCCQNMLVVPVFFIKLNSTSTIKCSALSLKTRNCAERREGLQMIVLLTNEINFNIFDQSIKVVTSNWISSI